MKKDCDLFSVSAFLLGFVLCKETTANWQNQLGNWFMLVGQTLCTNAAFKYQTNSSGIIQDSNMNVNEMFDTLKTSIDEVNRML